MLVIILDWYWAREWSGEVNHEHGEQHEWVPGGGGGGWREGGPRYIFVYIVT